MPLTGMSNNFPARTFDVPSKPPEIEQEVYIKWFKVVREMFTVFAKQILIKD